MPDGNAIRPQIDGLTEFGFTFGASHTQANWSDQRHVSWPKLVDILTSHVPGPKEGPCIVPAVFASGRRKKEEATQIDVAFLDSDSGATLDEITAAVRKQDWEAVISSTHSHMTTRTAVAKVNWDRFFAKHPHATAAEFLIAEKGYLPSVANDAVAVDTDERYVHLEHKPCPKFRIAIPLVKPWRASDYSAQREANDAWKERIEALARRLGLSHDQACTDTSRLFYLPRRPPDGVVPETAVTTGTFCDIFALPAAVSAAPLLESHDTPAPRPHAPSTRHEYVDPVTGEYLDLIEWAKAHGQTFLIVKALRTRRPSTLTGLVVDSSKVHIRCPNEEAHTVPGQDNATFAVNPGHGQGATGFVVHCRHGHCTGKDRLFFVGKMLAEGWLSIDDLTAPEHQIQPDTQPRAAPEKSPAPQTTGLPLIWFDEIQAVLDAKDFVQGVLIEQGSVVVYGESNAGKTFWTTDLALHVAAGMEWNGRRVDGGGVIYCVLEGGLGFRNRVAAWRDMTGQKGIPFAAVPAAINLLDPDADTPRLIAAILGAAEKIGQPIKLVVIDTLSRAMAGGNENAPDDMGALVRNMDEIRQVTGACLLFVHHSGKDQAKGARGHSLLRAAIDTEVEVVAEEAGEGKSATVVKQREMKKGDVFGFTLKVLELGKNQHGEEVTTCVVTPCEAGTETGHSGKSRPRKLSPNGTLGVRALGNAMGAKGALLPPLPEYPSNTRAVSATEWRSEFYHLKAGSPDTNKHAFSRGETELLAENVITARNGLVWFVRATDEPSH